MDEQPVETTLYSLAAAPPQPVERRSDERHLTLFRVGSVILGDRRELCLIKNISAGGMLIRCYSRVNEGAEVAIELKSGEPISGKIGWVRGDCAGIIFDSPVDIVELLASSMEGPRPRMPRVDIRCIATVRQGARSFGILARDISQGGVKLHTDRELQIGGDVVVSLPGLPPAQGVVRWRHDGCYGVTFNRLIALSELIAWLSDQRAGIRAAS